MKTIKFASIITTYRCNLKCHMCSIWKNPSAQAVEITPADIARLPFVRNINLTGGEPFLRSDLEEILAVLRPKTKRLVISTNGYHTERILEVAAKHPWIGVRVSLEGLPKANDELRGIKDGFDHGIRSLVELRHLGLKDIGLGITLSDKNAKDLMELYHLAKMLRVEFATAAVHNSFYFHKFDNAFQNPEIVTAELEKLIQEFLHSPRPKDWFRAYFNYGLINYIRGNQRLLPCKMGHNAFFLDPFGEIRPCNGGSGMTMGNIKEQDFKTIWNSERAWQVREQVDRCPHNCWMMGSVAEPMKQQTLTPGSWVLKQKLFGRKVA